MTKPAMTGDTPKMLDALARVQAFVAAREGRRGLDADVIYSLGMADEQIDLTLTDLRTMIAALRASVPADAVATLTVSSFRGHLENTSFDYIGSLPDGTYRLFAAPPAPTHDALRELVAKWRTQADVMEIDALEADSIGLAKAAVASDAKSTLLRENADELTALLAQEPTDGMSFSVGDRAYLAVALREDGKGRDAGTPVTIRRVGPWPAGEALNWREPLRLTEPTDYLAETDDGFGFALREEHIRSKP